MIRMSIKIHLCLAFYSCLIFGPEHCGLASPQQSIGHQAQRGRGRAVWPGKPSGENEAPSQQANKGAKIPFYCRVIYLGYFLSI